MSNTVIEEWEGHEVCASAIDVNIGHGLKEAMRVAPELFRAGSVIDIVTRVRIKSIKYEPTHKTEDKEPDFDGTWTRIHVGVPLAALPIDADSKAAKSVRAVLDKHIADVAKAKELAGQQSLLEEEERLAAEEQDEATKDRDDWGDDD